MRVLKGTLTFVLGIIMGIVLFVGAIAGTIYAVATSFTIGDITEKVGLTGEKAIFDEGSEITNKTIWEVSQDLIADVQNIGNMSLNEIAEKYGLTKHTDNFGEISGIDISPIFDVPINQLKDNLGVIVDNITLNDIGEFAGMDFTEYGLPILEDNLYSPVTKALDAILKSIDGDNITLRQIEDNFGITLGENAIFNQIKDTPLSTFGDVINGIEVGKIIDADCDKFVQRGENQIYVKVDRYEEVMGDEIYLVKDGAATYVHGRSGDENLVRELRFVKKTTTDEDGNTIDVVDEYGNFVYKVDNTCYTATEDNDKVYYRFIEFEAYDPEAYDPETMPAPSEFYVKAYGNHFVEVEIDGEYVYVPTTDGYVLLSSFAKKEDGSPFTTSEGKVTVDGDVYVYDDTLGAFVIAPTFGLNPEYGSATKDSRLDEGFDGYVRVHAGSSDVAIQVIAYTTVSGLNNATDTLMSLKLGDLIEVTEDSATILQTLKDKPLNKLSDSIDDLILGDVIEITYSLYAEDEKGDYVKKVDGDNFYYTLYNPTLHGGETRYTKMASGDPNHPDYILATEAEIANSSIQKFYLDEATKTMVSGTPADEKLYVLGSASSKILQRLASISIGDFSDAFNDLVLGDVIDVDMDTYEVVSDLSTAAVDDEFYTFDGSKYCICDDPETAILTKTVYKVVEKSETSSILKKLALVKVNDMSSEMESLIDTMRLDEVMDIDADVYKKVDNTNDPNLIYYYYDDGLYVEASRDYIDEHPLSEENRYFVVDSYGTSHAIVKKMARLNIADIGNRMEDVINTMRLDEVITIDPVLYMSHAEGKYVYVSSGNYYTLYNPAVHEDSTRYIRVTSADFTYRLATEEEIADGSVTKYVYVSSGNYYTLYNPAVHGDSTRYVRAKSADFTYRLATEDEIADVSVTKYYWNDTEKRMETTGSGDAYVKVTYSSLVLQRFARVKISDFSSALDGLALSDVMDIDADVYKKVDNTDDPNLIYYYYDDGLYVEASRDHINKHPLSEENPYFVVDSYGTSHVVMKKMAYLPVTDLGNRMEDVISDLYLKDLMDIYEFDVIKDDTTNYGVKGEYLVPYDDDYTIYDGDEAHYFSFIRDDNGKYYLRETMHFALNEAQTAALETGTVKYKYSLFDASLIADALLDDPDTFPEDMADLFKSGGHGYYKDEAGKMHYNPALCTYIAISGRSDLFSRLYTREKAESDYTGETLILPIYSNPTYKGTKMLYVKVLGNYVEYDATNPSHADLDKYLLLSEGFALVEDSTADTRDKYYLKADGTDIVPDKSSEYAGLTFIRNTVKHSAGGKDFYYYAPLDSEYDDAVGGGEVIPTFSKQMASTTYIETDDEASATLAFYDKKLIAEDEVPDDAEDVVYVNETIGYIVKIKGDNAEVLAFLELMDAGTKKVAYVQQQSAPALKAFAVHDVKVNSLDAALKEFTISDMMNIAPDSLFDDEDIKNASIDDLGNVFQKKLKNMTIQNILDWGNITTLSDEVLSIIGEATLEDFFASLSYANGDIHVDIVKLYDNIYKRQNAEG